MPKTALASLLIALAAALPAAAAPVLFGDFALGDTVSELQAKKAYDCSKEVGTEGAWCVRGKVEFAGMDWSLALLAASGRLCKATLFAEGRRGILEKAEQELVRLGFVRGYIKSGRDGLDLCGPKATINMEKLVELELSDEFDLMFLSAADAGQVAEKHNVRTFEDFRSHADPGMRIATVRKAGAAGIRVIFEGAYKPAEKKGVLGLF